MLLRDPEYAARCHDIAFKHHEAAQPIEVRLQQAA
jgi:hypothetical protein